MAFLRFGWGGGGRAKIKEAFAEVGVEGVVVLARWAARRYLADGGVVLTDCEVAAMHLSIAGTGLFGAA